MAYRIAGIDVHKKMLAVVIADVEVVGTWRFERQQIGTSPNQLRALSEWLVELFRPTMWHAGFVFQASIHASFEHPQ